MDHAGDACGLGVGGQVLNDRDVDGLGVSGDGLLDGDESPVTLPRAFEGAGLSVGEGVAGGGDRKVEAEDAGCGHRWSPVVVLVGQSAVVVVVRLRCAASCIRLALRHRRQRQPNR